MSSQDFFNYSNTSFDAGVGWTLLEGGNRGLFPSAMQSFKWALEKDSQDLQAIAGIGYINHQLENYETAIDNYDRAIEIFPRSADLFNWRAHSYRLINDLDNAIQDYTKAIEINPQHLEAHRQRGISYYESEDYNAAINDFTKVLNMDSKSFSVYFYRALARYYTMDLEGALSDIDFALVNSDQSPDSRDDIFAVRGEIFYALKSYQKAIDQYTRVIDINPGYTDIYYKRGFNKLALGDYKGAIIDFSEQINRNTSNADIYKNAELYYYRGHSKLKLDEKTEGCKDLKKAAELGDEEAQSDLLTKCS